MRLFALAGKMKNRLRIAEWITASNAVFFGLWIVFAPMAFQSYLFASEWTWGIWPIAAGLLLAVSLWRGWRVGRICGILMLVAFFVGVAIIVALTNYRITTLPIYWHLAMFYALLAIVEANGGNE